MKGFVVVCNVFICVDLFCDVLLFGVVLFDLIGYMFSVFGVDVVIVIGLNSIICGCVLIVIFLIFVVKCFIGEYVLISY